MDLKELLKSRGTKVGTGIVGGSGLIAIALSMMSQRIDAVEKSIEYRENAIMQVVDTKHQQIVIRMDDMKEMLIKIDNRLYHLNKRDLYSNVLKEENSSN